jgi:hypothetical protein
LKRLRINILLVLYALFATWSARLVYAEITQDQSQHNKNQAETKLPGAEDKTNQSQEGTKEEAPLGEIPQKALDAYKTGNMELYEESLQKIAAPENYPENISLLESLAKSLESGSKKEAEKIRELIREIQKAQTDSSKKTTGVPRPQVVKGEPAAKTAPSASRSPPSPQKKLESYIAGASQKPGGTSAEKVRERLGELQRESHLDPDLKGLSDKIFDPRRVETLQLENGFSILPMGAEDVPEVLSTDEFKKQQSDVLDRVGIKVDPEAGSFVLPKEFDLSQLTERELRIAGLEKLSKETRPSALSEGEVLLPKGNGKFQVVVGKAYEQSRKSELEIIAQAGVVMRGLEFQGFSDASSKTTSDFFGKTTSALQNPNSSLGRALDRIYPGLREQVLVESAFGKHYPDQRKQGDTEIRNMPNEAPKDPRLARLWDLAKREQDLRKKFELPVGRTVIDSKARESLIREHREAVADWGREALRLSLEGVDPAAYAPAALQQHLRGLSGFSLDTTGISPKNFSALEAREKARASYAEDLADVARVVNPTREVKTRGGPIQWKDPARIELFSPEKPAPISVGGRFLEDVAQKATDEYNKLYHYTRGPKLSSDTTTYSDLELRQFSRNSVNTFQSNVKSLMELSGAVYGDRWAQRQFWYPEESRKIDESLNRSLHSLWQDVRTFSKLGEKDPRLKPLADAFKENFKLVEKIQDKPQELASKYTRDVIANSAAAVVTVGTMGAGSLLFGVGQAGKLVTLVELGYAGTVGAGIAVTGNLIDVAARRFIDGDQNATVTLKGLSSAAVFGGTMGVVSRVAPGLGDLAGAYFGYQGTLYSAYAAQDGKFGAATGEFISTVGTLSAVKYMGSRSRAPTTESSVPSGTGLKNPLAPLDNLLTTPISPRRSSPAVLGGGETGRAPPEATRSTEQVIKRIEAQRGEPVTPGESDTISQRESEIQAVMSQRGLSYDDARANLESGALVLTGQNSFAGNKLTPREGGKPESLHRVTSQVLADLPKNFHSLPHAERLSLVREQIQKSFEISPERPFEVEKGKFQGSLLAELSEAIAGITPVPSSVLRYRSIPLPEGTSVRTVEAAQKVFYEDTRGGRGYVHTSTEEGARNFSSASGQFAILVFPKGTQSAVFNGEGPVFREGRAAQGSISPSRAKAFAPNDWGAFDLGDLRVSRVEDQGGRTYIYLDKAQEIPFSSSPEGKKSMPRSLEERLARTADVVREKLPASTPATVQKIQQIVEDVGHNNRTGVVTHGQATRDQLKARIKDVAEALVELRDPRIDLREAREIAKEVMRRGSAGNARDPSQGTVLTPDPKVDASTIPLVINGVSRIGTETNPLESDPVAKREAKYRVGITKDQKPVYVFENTIFVDGSAKKIRQEFYEVNLGPNVGRAHVILMKHSAGEVGAGHSYPHWEVGLPKSDATGRLFMGENGERAGAYEYHSNNKIRVFFRD